MANRNFARAMRRKTQWAGFGNEAGAATVPVMLNVTAGTTAIISVGAITAGGAGIFDDETTITRTIGRVAWSLSADGAAGTRTSVAIGCAVVRNEALTAGISALPSPETDPDFEWLYYSVHQLQQVGAQLDGASLEGESHAFDVRGQRIVRLGQTLVWLAAVTSAAVAVDARVGVGGRYLVKLT